MGGNALSRPSVRLNRVAYEGTAADCLMKLRALHPGKRIAALGSYRAKSDFGDLDILLEDGGQYDHRAAAEALSAVEVVQNGPVTSVGVVVSLSIPESAGCVFQVDLIRIEPEAFDFAMGYFGHGDAGNLMGRLYHACGLALRHDGLFYYLRDGDYKFREIALTRKFDEALPFMGYDPEVFARGFDTQEDIYRYVANSVYFNPGIFLLENRNAKSRVRDKKRPMYMQFLKFCEAHPGLASFPYPQDKAAWMPRIAEFFPSFQAEFDRAQADLAELRAVKAKFSGVWVSQITGLQGKDLGTLMRRFKESFASPEDQRAFVLENDIDAIEARVRRLQ